MKRILIIVIVAGAWGFSGAQEHFPDTAGTGLFSSDSLLRLTLRFDLAGLKADVGEDPSYHSAILEYSDPVDGLIKQLDVEIRARGSFRKDPDNCDFPPFKMKFKRKDDNGSLFEGIKDLKLVTHCQSSVEDFDQYVLQEYLIYRGYNVFTDYSLRVRLAEIRYEDSGGLTMSRFAFLLEDADAMAERNGGELLDLESAPANRLDKYHYALMSIYNFMVLNTDYSIPIVHNIELVSMDHFKPPIPVPYDFDWSGMINIPYDSPYAENKTRISGRKYKGPCMKRKEMEEILLFMFLRRPALYDLYENFPYLDEELRARSIQELNMFYITIGNKELVRKEIRKNCIE